MRPEASMDDHEQSERLNAILDLLAESGQVEVEDIVTPTRLSRRRPRGVISTPRLAAAADPYTRRGDHGQSVAYDLPIRYKREQHTPEQAADRPGSLALIMPRGAVVGLSGGTTNTALAMCSSRPRRPHAPSTAAHA